MKIVMNAERHAGGISKLGPMLLSSVVRCLMKSVPPWANIMLDTNVATRIGTNLIICLVSSTCVTGHSIHGEVGPLFTAALSRNLQVIKC